MKLLFPITIFFLVTVNINNALRCIDNHKEINIPKGFNFFAVQRAINNLKLIDQYDECHVIIFFHYYTEEIMMKSNKDIESNSIDTNYEVFFQTSIGISRGAQVFDKGSITNIVEFACDDADECDRYFILDRLNWLLKVNYTKLESVIRLLPIDPSSLSKNYQKKRFTV